MTWKQIDLHKGSHQSTSDPTPPSCHDCPPFASYTFFILKRENPSIFASTTQAPMQTTLQKGK